MMRAWAIVLVLLTACGAPSVREEPLRRDLLRTAGEARTAFDAGELDRARSLFQRALDLARLMDDPLEIGNANYNLAVLLAEAAEFSAAQQTLAEASAAFSRAGEPLQDLHLLTARVAWLAGDLDGADAALLRAATDPGPTDAHRLESELLRGELACARRDQAGAQAALARAIAVAGGDAAATGNPGFAALAAGIEELAGRWRVAAAHHDVQAQLLRDARLYRRMAHALVRAGNAHAAAGAWRDAADRMLRAAQSRSGARDLRRAEAALAQATEFAAKDGGADLRARVAALARELTPPPRP